MRDTNKNHKPDLTTAETSKKSLLRLLGDLTVHDRMKYSPDPYTVFDGCELRGAPYADLRGLTKKECLEYYTLSKFVTNQQTCYRFQRNQENLSHFPTSAVAFDPETPGIESSITLNTKVFENVREFKVFYSPPREKSIAELMTPKAFDRGPNLEYNHFGLRYRMVSLSFSFSS